MHETDVYLLILSSFDAHRQTFICSSFELVFVISVKVLVHPSKLVLPTAGDFILSKLVLFEQGKVVFDSG